MSGSSPAQPDGDGYCPKTDLLVRDCAHCRGIPEPRLDLDDDDDERPPSLGPWFTARRPGRCSDCKSPTYEGELIRADGNGGYLCGMCGDAELDLIRAD